MQNIKSLLERITKALNRDEITKEAVSEVVRHCTGLRVPLENLSLKDGVLTVSAPAVVKNEIMLKSEAIMTELRGRALPVKRIMYI